MCEEKYLQDFKEFEESFKYGYEDYFFADSIVQVELVKSMLENYTKIVADSLDFKVEKLSTEEIETQFLKCLKSDGLESLVNYAQERFVNMTSLKKLFICNIEVRAVTKKDGLFIRTAIDFDLN